MTRVPIEIVRVIFEQLLSGFLPAPTGTSSVDLRWWETESAHPNLRSLGVDSPPHPSHEVQSAIEVQVRTFGEVDPAWREVVQEYLESVCSIDVSKKRSRKGPANTSSSVRHLELFHSSFPGVVKASSSQIANELLAAGSRITCLTLDQITIQSFSQLIALLPDRAALQALRFTWGFSSIRMRLFDDVCAVLSECRGLRYLAASFSDLAGNEVALQKNIGSLQALQHLQLVDFRLPRDQATVGLTTKELENLAFVARTGPSMLSLLRIASACCPSIRTIRIAGLDGPSTPWAQAPTREAASTSALRSVAFPNLRLLDVDARHPVECGSALLSILDKSPRLRRLRLRNIIVPTEEGPLSSLVSKIATLEYAQIEGRPGEPLMELENAPPKEWKDSGVRVNFVRL